MLSQNNQTIDLSEIATQAMVQRGFITTFSDLLTQELNNLSAPQTSGILKAGNSQISIKDMRELLWASIDNEETKDIDQLTYAESDPRLKKDRIYIAIADVDNLIKKNMLIDKQASHNTTSVYTVSKIFPMLPFKISEDLTSLHENVDRYAIVIEIAVDSEGDFELIDIYPALVHSKSKLNYIEVGNWLIDKNNPPFPRPLPQGLSEQLRLQDRIAQRIKECRYRKGAVSFTSTDVQPVIQNGVPTKLISTIHTRANTLIENFMIAANVCMTEFLKKK